MNKAIHTLTVASILLGSIMQSFAHADTTPTHLTPKQIYVSLLGGASFSMNTDMHVWIDPVNQWDIAYEGYDSDLGTSEVLGVGLGYVINSVFQLEIDLNHRNSFEYEKYQTSPPDEGNKTRHFNLENTTLMANLLIDGAGISKHLVHKFKKVAVSPFINLGAGVSYNTVSDFHSELEAPTDPSVTKTQIFGVLNDNTETAFAYQLGAGLNFSMTDKVSLLVGYQYLNGGEFESNDYLLSPSIPIAPWEGRLQSNEVYAALRIALTSL